MHWRERFIQGQQEHLNPTTHGVLDFVFRQSGRTAFTLQVVTCLNYYTGTNTCHDTFAADTCQVIE